MNAAQQSECRKSAAGREATREKRLRTLVSLALAAAFALSRGAPWRRTAAAAIPSCRNFRSEESRKESSPPKNRNDKGRSTRTTRQRPTRFRPKKRPTHGAMCARRLLAQGRRLPRLRKTLPRRRRHRQGNSNNFQPSLTAHRRTSLQRGSAFSGRALRPVAFARVV